MCAGTVATSQQVPQRRHRYLIDLPSVGGFRRLSFVSSDPGIATGDVAAAEVRGSPHTSVALFTSGSRGTTDLHAEREPTRSATAAAGAAGRREHRGELERPRRNIDPLIAATAYATNERACLRSDGFHVRCYLDPVSPVGRLAAMNNESPHRHAPHASP